MRPVIAITHSVNQSKFTILAMKLAVWLAHGQPICISTNKNIHLKDYDGLIIGGGVDINPERYGKQKKNAYGYQDDRDALEFEHLQHALTQGLPILGICRGAQLINVFHKGTLHLDIEKAYEKSKYPAGILGYIFFRKWIKIVKPSQLFDVFKSQKVQVNSLHRQSIAQIGAGFRATAHEKNGIIQCIEHMSAPFIIGVQFHPEYLLYRTRSRRLFKALVFQAEKNLKQKSSHHIAGI